MNNEKKIDNITRKIVVLSILTVVLIVAFVAYGIRLKKKDFNEAKTITYLKEKYPESDFKIEELIEKEQATTEGLWCDGTYFIRPRKIKGKYIYHYEVLSTKDDIKFIVECIDDNGKASFEDSYNACKNNDNQVKKIISSIKVNLGYENLNEKTSFELEHESLYYKSNIDIHIDEKLKDVLNKDYINLLYNTSSDIKRIINSNDSIDKSYVEYYVTLYYKDDIDIPIGDSRNFGPGEGLHIYGDGAGKWSKYTVDYYLKKLNEKNNEEPSSEKSYNAYRNNDEHVEKIINIIKENLGHENLYGKSFLDAASLKKISIYIDEKLDDVLNENYINLLHKTKNSIDATIKSNKSGDININVFLHYKDDIQLELYHKGGPLVFDYGTGSWSNIDIESYWKKLDDWRKKYE